MKVFFVLFISLFTDGDPTPLTLGGTHAYESLESCQDDANRIMNWLNQPGVALKYDCERIERRVRSKEEGLG